MALRFFVLPGLATALIIGCAGDVSVCGNGLLDPGEACDAPGDVGCDGACHLTGTTAWTRIIGEPETTTKIVDVAVDRGGQIVVQHFESAVDGAGVDLEGVDVTLSSFAASDLCTLKPAAFFEACLGAFDVNCAYSSEWVEGCVSHAPAACEP